MAYLGMLKKEDPRRNPEPEKKKWKPDKRGKRYRGKTEYNKYLKSKWWKDRREKYWLKNKTICFCCKLEASELHHYNYNVLGKEKDSDLIPLCRKCHQDIHDNVKDGKFKLKSAHYRLRELFNKAEKVLKQYGRT